MYLNCHTYHSLRYGTLSIEELVQQAQELQVSTLALTDINTVTGIYDFYKLCLDKGIKPVVGVGVRNEDDRYYITLAKSESCMAEINRLLTAHNCENSPLPRSNPDFRDVYVVYP